MKKIDQYLHFYLGCDIKMPLEQGKLVGITESEYERGKTICIIDIGSPVILEWYIEEVKPILRKLSSMTEEEWKEWGRTPGTVFGRSSKDAWLRQFEQFE